MKAEEIEKISGIEYRKDWRAEYYLIDKRITNASKGKYFVHSGNDCEITFAIRPESKIGINRIREKLNQMLTDPTKEYIEVCAKDLHNSMKLVSRMPTVCTAMLEVFDESKDKILEGDRFTSRLRIVYKRR